MKKAILSFFALLFAAVAWAASGDQDSTTYRGYFFNKEYGIYIQLDAYRPSVIVPGQSIFGELNGYLGDNKDGRKWLFTSAEITKKKEVMLEIINDYGSEDLVATFEMRADGSFVLTQGKGSTLKIARNRKWQKLPSQIVFEKKR